MEMPKPADSVIIDRKSILLIDDNDMNNFIIQRLLALHDIDADVHCCLTGVSALEFLQNSSDLPSMIFLDLNMPLIDGWEFLEEFRQLSKPDQTALFLLTGSICPQDELKSKKYPGVDAFIPKPISADILLELTRKSL